MPCEGSGGRGGVDYSFLMMRPTSSLLTLAAVVAQLSTGAAAQDASSWTLTSTTFNRSSFTVQPFVSNGYIGQRIPVEGHGYMQFTPVKVDGDTSEGTQGWPLFTPRSTAAMVAGFYAQVDETVGTNFAQTGGQQPIALLPTWSSLYVTIGNKSYGVGTPETEISNWTQSASLQDGLVVTSLLWTPSSGNTSVNLTYSIYAHRTKPNLGAVKLDISGLAEGTEVGMTDVLDGAGAWRTTFRNSSALSNSSIYTAVQPAGIANVTAYEVSVVDLSPASASVSSSCYEGLSTNASTTSQCYSITSPSSGSISAVKFVGIASSDAFPGVEFETARKAATSAKEAGWEATLAEHSAAWDDIWESADIEIGAPYFEELQLATRASLFNMLTNVRNGSEPTGLGDNSIAPAGLTSDSYSGQIFWDAPTWMFPSLLALFPSFSESIVDFYVKQFGAAQENAKQYNQSGALYPWLGARFGNCTGAGPCFDYEYHLDNDISLAIYQYHAAVQNDTWLEQKGFPIVEAVGDFWAKKVNYNTTTLRYDTYNETDPDEYANFKNNAAFTNAGISVLYKQAKELAKVLNVTVPSNWSLIESNITILRDPSSGIILEYDGFNGTTEVKQADVVLLNYPLEYSGQTKAQALTSLDFYAGATSASGPGMTYSVFSIGEASLAVTGCAAYTYLLAASQPYSRAPFYQFSEQTTDEYATNGGTNPAFTFLTGHGGFLQTFTHGFTGYRSRLEGLYLDPSLPVQLSNYTLKGFHWGDSTFSINLNTNETTIYHKTGSKAVNVEIASANIKAGNYSLAVGDSLVVPTRHTTGTLIEGNFAQCAQAISDDVSFTQETPVVVPGQYALAAIDGSNATTWQPLGNTSTTLSVDLFDPKNLTAFHINWGGNPAISFTITAGLTLTNQTSVASQNVTISAPFDAATAEVVAVAAGNLTDIRLPQGVRARYVNVTIEGSFMGDGKGATIAEFAAM
ncbi:glycoside hydrolase family 65 protein [Leucosporidium creatinivorum]|uniref:alpha,alpha-trehalase n=1 Tax=Leucosporidium creatinivorum TaxID=106004 RepID=A0A1Y2G358_9BASI|nr:glycoside hydrolase family 65 protein [Leucosporidium creatinivorum]